MPVHSVERKLAAIFAADIAGYSRLMARDEVGTLARLKARRVIIDELIAAHRGRIFNTAGDSVVADFVSAVDAVQCAVAVQTAIATENVGGAVDEPMQFRIGVHIGDVMVDGSNLLGDGVNIAARLEALAAPGGICVSRVVRDQVQDKLAFSFEDLGEQSVKNIARPVHAYAVSLDTAPPAPVIAVPAHAGAPGGGLVPRRAVIIVASVIAVIGIAIVAWWAWPMGSSTGSSTASVQAPTAASLQGSPSPATADAKAIQAAVAPRLSIVVLPFNNLSNDPEQQYFADGVTEDLTTDLSRIEGSFVISRNTAFTYKGKPVNAKQIGRELGVRYVLEGSVQRSAKQVRVNAQLIDAETGAHLWAERFERDVGDLSVLQNEITGRIAVALQSALVSAEAARPTANPDAVDYIFRARAAGSKPLSRDMYAESISLFERALDLDPRSVEARSRLARTLVGRVLDQMTDTADADIARAEDLTAQVLAFSPSYPLGHYAKGQLLRVQRRCAEAIPEFEAALASNRNWADAISHIGRCKTALGLLDEAITLHEQAIRLDPIGPNIAIEYVRIGSTRLLQSRVREAITWLEKARAADPQHPWTRAYLTAAYALDGQTDRAVAELAEARRLGGDGFLPSIARARANNTSFGGPAIQALAEATYFAGLRKAGMPEE